MGNLGNTEIQTLAIVAMVIVAALLVLFAFAVARLNRRRSREMKERRAAKAAEAQAEEDEYRAAMQALDEKALLRMIVESLNAVRTTQQAQLDTLKRINTATQLWLWLMILGIIAACIIAALSFGGLV